MADQAVADPVVVEVVYWAERLSVSHDHLELAVAAWFASQNDANNQEL